MIATIEMLKKRVEEQLDESVRDDLQRAVMEGRSRRGHHTELGVLCEQAGLIRLAFAEFQLALRDDRDDPIAAYRLAQHYRERGDADQAIGLLERLLERRPAELDWLALYVEILIEEQAQPRADAAIKRAIQAGLPENDAAELTSRVRPKTTRPEEPVSEKSWPDSIPVPSDADCVRFHTLFSGREGVYARQWARRGGEGGYSPIHEPLTPAIIRNHLLGTYTVGVYPVRLDGTVTFFALDLDINKHALQQARADHEFAQSLRQVLQQEGPRLLNVLHELGFHPLFENSGYKGRHLWVFLERPESAATMHLFGRLFLNWQASMLPPHLHLEFFPKQARLKGKGLGNLIKLPLGIHRRTGRRSLLLDPGGTPAADPFTLLRAAIRDSQSVLHAAIDKLKADVSINAPVETETEPEAQHTTTAASATTASDPQRSVPVTLPDTLQPWTEADFETDQRVRYILQHCNVLAELKRMVDQYRQLDHQEQLVLIHSLGHVPGGPQAVNYLLAKCVDVGPEKFMKSQLKGNPVACPSIRKKIPHVTRRAGCNCSFEFAADRYPTPTLHLLTLPDETPPITPTEPADDSLVKLAQRFAVLDCRHQEIESEWKELRDRFFDALRSQPDRQVACPEGRFRIDEIEGVEQLEWEPRESETPKQN